MEEVMGQDLSSAERKGWDLGLDEERVSVSLLEGLPLNGGFWLEIC